MTSSRADRRARRAAALAVAEAAQDALAAHDTEDDEYLRLNTEVGRAWAHPDIPWWRHPLGAHRVIAPVFGLAAVAIVVVLGHRLAVGTTLTEVLAAAGGVVLAVTVTAASLRAIRDHRADIQQFRTGTGRS